MTSIDPELLKHATPEELAQLEQDLVFEAATLSPIDYAQHVTDGRTQAYPHTKLLSRYCKAVITHSLYDSGIGPEAVWTPLPDDPDDGQWLHPETGEEAHNILTISAPPQHGKSLIVTETVPAWFLTLYPHKRVIVTGYESDFAKGFGRKNRDKIESAPDLGIMVSPQTRAADDWEIEGHDGGLITAGAGGPITGKRGDLILIDDPVKNSEDALSPTQRKKNKEWWQSTVKSRVRTDTVVIVIQTRWHEDDLTGHIHDTERCYSLNLPALAFSETHPDDPDLSVDPDDGTPDPLRRAPGEALCPQLQTKTMLLAKKETGDSSEDEPGGVLWFSALYQGKPNIEGGGILPKPYRYFTIEKNHSGRPYFRTKQNQGLHKESYLNECIFFVTADLAVSLKSHADYTVFSLFAWTPHNEMLLVDMMRDRIESTDHVREAEAFWRKAKQTSSGAGVRFFGVENKTFGLSLIQTLRREAKIPVKKLEADADKVARAVPVGMMIRQDQFFLNKDLEHLDDLEHEMQQFPNGRHDDMVDTLGYAALQEATLPHRDLTEKSLPEQVEERNRKRKRRLHPVIGRAW